MQKQSKHTDASLWPLSVSFCSCCWRRTNVWRWSSPEPRWLWPRLRWRRTRCCTAWRASKSTPARPGSLSLFTLSLSSHSSTPPCSEELKGRGVSSKIKGKKGDFVTKTAPFTRFFCCWVSRRVTLDLQNNSLIKQCRVCVKTQKKKKIHVFTRLSSVLCSPLRTVEAGRESEKRGGNDI